MVGCCHGTFSAAPSRQVFSEATGPSAADRRTDGRSLRAGPGRGAAAVPRGRRGRGGGGQPRESRRGAALGLRPGEMRRGREVGGGGGRWGQRISPRPAPGTCPDGCSVSSAHRRVFSSVLWKLRVLLTCPGFSRVLPRRNGGKRPAPALHPPGTQYRGFLCRAREGQLKFV